MTTTADDRFVALAGPAVVILFFGTAFAVIFGPTIADLAPVCWPWIAKVLESTATILAAQILAHHLRRAHRRIVSRR